MRQFWHAATPGEPGRRGRRGGLAAAGLRHDTRPPRWAAAPPPRHASGRRRRQAAATPVPAAPEAILSLSRNS